jgi:hypothetical protein
MLVTLFVVTLSMNGQDLNGNTYKIQSTANNKMLDASDRDLGKNGGAIQLWDNSDTPNQNWKFDYANKGANIYYITTVSPKAGKYKYLDASARDYGKNGGALQLWEDNGYANGSGAEANQLWVVTKNGDGTYRISNAHPKTKGTSLDANPSNENKNGRKVQMWQTINHKNQAWKLIALNKKTINTTSNTDVAIPVGGDYVFSIQNNKGEELTGLTSLRVGETLGKDKCIISHNGKYILKLGDDDGHLCVYEVVNGKQGKFVWGNNIYGFKNAKLEIQKNGNLVVIDATNKIRWSSKTIPEEDPMFKDNRLKPVRLKVEDDGTLMLFAKSGLKVWTSKNK